jgi:hypothetical protein
MWKATFCSRSFFRSSSVWMLVSPTIGRFSTFVGTSRAEMARCDFSENFAVSRSAGSS